MAGRIRGRARDNRLTIMGIVAVVVCLTIVLGAGMYTAKASLAAKSKEEATLMAQLKKEQKRSEELAEQKKYQKTDAYIEEIARKFGYVYKGEIVLKPSDE